MGHITTGILVLSISQLLVTHDDLDKFIVVLIGIGLIIYGVIENNNRK